jgi:hypothetical protein
MKKFLLLTTALATFSGVFAKKVAFVVDMTGQTVGPNGVHVAGNFQNWNPGGTPLLPIPGQPNMYGTLLDINAKQVIEFKLINGNDWPQEESVPALVKKGHPLNGQDNGNRWRYIDSTANDTTVINLKFSAEAPTGKFAVRLAVDMQKVTTISPLGVSIAGTIQTAAGFPEWTPGATGMANLFSDKNKVFEVILYVPTGSYEFKYVNGNAWGSDESVPTTCAPSNNRTINVSGNIAVPKVCYSSCDACITRPIPQYNVTVSVDMSTNCNIDSVEVIGELVGGWGSGIKINPVSSGSKVYSYSFKADSSSGRQYKFRYFSEGKKDIKWENVATPSTNRVLDLKSDTVLPTTCFSSFAPCTPSPAPSNITFKVDLSDETPQVVYLICDFKGFKDGAIRMSPVAGAPGAFTTTVNNVCPTNIVYRFGNGTDSTDEKIYEVFKVETDSSCRKPNGFGGHNRILERTTTNQTVYFKYGSCTLGKASTTQLGLNQTSLQLFPNPTGNFTVLSFNDNAKFHTINIVDITGKVVRTIENYDLSTLKIEKAELKSGLYFVNVSNENSEKATVKLLIQE